MKNNLLFFTIFSITLLKAQEDILLNNVWYLQNMENECLGFDAVDNDEFDVNDIQLIFTETNGVINFSTTICANFNGTAVLSSDSIDFQNLMVTGERCSEFLNLHYEEAYECALMAAYSYEIIENSDGSLNLKMQNDIFMGLNFSNQKLSVWDSTNQFDVELYPNPVKDFLYIKKSEKEMTEIKIYNAIGRLVIHEKIKATNHKINVSELPSGIYFLQVVRKQALPIRARWIKE